MSAFPPPPPVSLSPPHSPPPSLFPTVGLRPRCPHNPLLRTPPPLSNPRAPGPARHFTSREVTPGRRRAAYRGPRLVIVALPLGGRTRSWGTSTFGGWRPEMTMVRRWSGAGWSTALPRMSRKSSPWSGSRGSATPGPTPPRRKRWLCLRRGGNSLRRRSLSWSYERRLPRGGRAEGSLGPERPGLRGRDSRVIDYVTKNTLAAQAKTTPNSASDPVQSPSPLPTSPQSYFMTSCMTNL